MKLAGCRRRGGKVAWENQTVALMEFEVGEDESHAPHTILTVRGDLDVYTCPRLRERLIELINQGNRQIVLDLNQAGFIDSAGLGVIVAGLKRLRGHEGDLALVCEQPNILRLLEITGLTSVFRIASTVEEAMAP